MTVTEVGRFKKEIAYHGDAINTASRIQGECSKLGEDLLISGALLERLPEGGRSFAPLGNVSLRGKDEVVPIFAVTNRS